MFKGNFSWKVVGLLVAATFLIVTFQNCGSSGFENTDFDDMASITQDERLASLPFPYDVRVNQIAFMSCPYSSQPSADSHLFTVKVGAYDNVGTPAGALNIGRGGLELTPEFIAGWGSVASTYSSTVQRQKLEEALSGNPQAANAQMQLSFRDSSQPRTTLGQFFNPNGSTYSSPKVAMLPALNQPSIYKEFSANLNGKISYFPTAPTRDETNIEASLTFPAGLNSQTSLVGNLSGSLLTIGFGSGTENDLAGPSATDSRLAYGEAFRMSFGKPPQYSSTQFLGSPSILTSVSEENLETGTGGNYWAAGRCFYFKVVKPEHRLNRMYAVDPQTSMRIETTICPPEPLYADNARPNSYERLQGLYANLQRPALLHAMRRFFPPAQFDINVSKGCIVPLQSAEICYSSYGGQVPAYSDVFYHPNPADANIPEGSYSTAGDLGSPRFHRGCGGTLVPCPQYASICVRP